MSRSLLAVFSQAGVVGPVNICLAALSTLLRTFLCLPPRARRTRLRGEGGEDTVNLWVPCGQPQSVFVWSHITSVIIRCRVPWRTSHINTCKRVDGTCFQSSAVMFGTYMTKVWWGQVCQFDFSRQRREDEKIPWTNPEDSLTTEREH